MVTDRYASITKYCPRLGAQVLELIARGYFVREAAAAAGVTPVCVGLWRRKYAAFGRAYALAIDEAKSTGVSLPEGACLRRWEAVLTSDPVKPRPATRAPSVPHQAVVSP